ncbi:hypothetical protein MTR_2g011285 [Medicago truncatula]|uniref:Uncharacterized protein n=1 Tax=Medicago truncatula TaxID=3880 RepID=A0A072V4A6_MEDTR|nr:hypothetical protein MTR_2g011285 [Medicago truncatula]
MSMLLSTTSQAHSPILQGFIKIDFQFRNDFKENEVCFQGSDVCPTLFSHNNSVVNILRVRNTNRLNIISNAVTREQPHINIKHSS